MCTRALCRQSAVLSSLVLIASLLLAPPTAPAEDESPDTAQPIQPAEVDLGRPVNFQKDIKPILEDHCLACHNSIISENDLSLETLDGLRQGGKAGPAVVAEKPDESLLYQLASRAEKPAMPPLPNDASAKPLSPKELGLLRQWIREGAKAEEQTQVETVQWQPVPENVNSIYSVALSPWGRFVAAGRVNRIHVYDLILGERVAELADPNLSAVQHEGAPMYPSGAAHLDFVHSLAFSPDGTLLASGGYRVVKLWKRPRDVQRQRFDTPAPVTAVALSADGRWAALGCADGTLQLRNLEDGEAKKTLTGHKGAITALQFQPTARQRVEVDQRVRESEETLQEALQQLADAREALRRGPQPDAPRELTAEEKQQHQKLAAAKQAAEKQLAQARDQAEKARKQQSAFLERAAEESRLVSSSDDKTIRVWNPTEGTAVRQISTSAAVNDLTLNKDGSRVVTAEADHVIRVWALSAESEEAKEKSGEGENAQKPVREIQGHNKPVTSIDLILPEGDQIVSGSEDGTVRLWNLSDGKQVRSMNHGGPVTAVSGRPDGRAVASVGQNEAAKLWKVNDGKLIAEMKGNPRADRRVAQLEEDLTVAQQKVSLADSAVSEAEKRVEDRNKAVKEAREEKEKAQKALDEAKEKEKQAKDKLAAAKEKLDEKSDDEDLKKKVDEAQKEVTEASKAVDEAKKAHERAEQSLALAEKTLQEAEEQLKRAKTEQDEAKTHRTQVEAERDQARKTAGNAAKAYTGVAFSPDGGKVVTAGDDHLLQVWDAESGRPREGLSGHQAAIADVVFGADGLVLSGSADKTAVVWNASPKWRFVGTLGTDPESPLDYGSSPFAGRVMALDFGPDGRFLATGGGDPSREGELMIWDVAERAPVRQIEEAHSDVVMGLEFSHDGARLVSGSTDKFVKLFETATGDLIRSFEGHTNHVLDVTLKADGSAIASASADATIKVWNTETGEQQRTINNYSKQVTSIQFVGATDHIISCGGDRSVRFHQTGNGRQFRTFGGGQDFLYAVAATRDESIVAAGGETGVLRVWNGENGNNLMTFDPPPRPVKPQNLQASAAAE